MSCDYDVCDENDDGDGDDADNHRTLTLDYGLDSRSISLDLHKYQVKVLKSISQHNTNTNTPSVLVPEVVLLTTLEKSKHFLLLPCLPGFGHLSPSHHASNSESNSLDF